LFVNDRREAQMHKRKIRECISENIMKAIVAAIPTFREAVAPLS
jgi:hypothetical protein